ncbi:MAG TPA: FKBP-type peptidyl-prolyl cis-trans isomerase [Terracidiphilus sp.]|nr:FKBP-type peptidyl-prolyl cis-trans isomerase [Terracidiphilus sp.]
MPQDYGYVIAGWDQGFYGMRVGGKRRLFIPYQLAYGARGRPGPDASHPGIPRKADMIYDIELISVAELPDRGAAACERRGTHPAPSAAVQPLPSPPAPPAQKQHP